MKRKQITIREFLNKHKMTLEDMSLQVNLSVSLLSKMDNNLAAISDRSESLLHSAYPEYQFINNVENPQTVSTRQQALIKNLSAELDTERRQVKLLQNRVKYLERQLKSIAKIIESDNFSLRIYPKDKNKKKNDEIRDEINAVLSGFNSVLEMWAFGFTDPDDGFPLNFENILKTLNDVMDIIGEALEVYNELNKLLKRKYKEELK